MAEGVRRAAEQIGRGSEAYAYHSKGLELTGYDPRGAMGTALGYAVSSRGGDFTSVYAVPEFRWKPEQGREWFGSEKAVDRLSVEGKGQLVKRAMVVSAALDALGLCKVPVLSIVCDYSLRDEAALTAALTGWEATADELVLAGERIVNAERLINLRLGTTRADDDLPDHFVEDRVPDAGPTHGMSWVSSPSADCHSSRGCESTPPEAGEPEEIGFKPHTLPGFLGTDVLVVGVLTKCRANSEVAYPVCGTE